MTIKTTMRTLLAAGVLLMLGTAQAQDKGPIKMVVPFGAGTTTDTVARVVGEGWARRCSRR